MTARDCFRTRSFGAGNRLAKVVLSLIASIGVSQAAFATAITVPDFSFENADAGSGGLVVDGSSTGWVSGTGAAGYQNPGNQGWSITGIDGNQTGYANSYAGPSWLTSSATLATVQAGYTYTLTVGVGARSDNLAPLASYQLDFNYKDDGGALQSFASSGAVDASNTPAGTIVNKSLSFTVATGNAAIGHGLYLVLANPMPAGDNTQVNFDNVRLDASIVPEPGTITLFGTGLFGLLAYAWRKRR